MNIYEVYRMFLYILHILKNRLSPDRKQGDMGLVWRVSDRLNTGICHDRTPSVFAHDIHQYPTCPLQVIQRPHIPVSYTHLDVYKRQPYNSSLMRAAESGSPVLHLWWESYFHNGQPENGLLRSPSIHHPASVLSRSPCCLLYTSCFEFKGRVHHTFKQCCVALCIGAFVCGCSV